MQGVAEVDSELAEGLGFNPSAVWLEEQTHISDQVAAMGLAEGGRLRPEAGELGPHAQRVQAARRETSTMQLCKVKGPSSRLLLPRKCCRANPRKTASRCCRE